MSFETTKAPEEGWVASTVEGMTRSARAVQRLTTAVRLSPARPRPTTEEEKEGAAGKEKETPVKEVWTCACLCGCDTFVGIGTHHKVCDLCAGESPERFPDPPAVGRLEDENDPRTSTGGYSKHRWRITGKGAPAFDSDKVQLRLSWHAAVSHVLELDPMPRNPYAELAAWFARGEDLAEENRCKDNPEPSRYFSRSCDDPMCEPCASTDFRRTFGRFFRTTQRRFQDYTKFHRLPEFFRVFVGRGATTRDALTAGLATASSHYEMRLEAAARKREERERLARAKAVRFGEGDSEGAVSAARALDDAADAGGQDAALEELERLAAAAADGGDAADRDLAAALALVRSNTLLLLLPSLRRMRPALAACADPAFVDRTITRTSERLRVLFCLERDTAAEVQGGAAGCVDVYACGPGVAVAEPVPEGLPLLCDWRADERLPPGTPSVVDRNLFERRFRDFHGGLLDGLCWDNLCAAGGAVTAALQPRPHAGKAPYEFLTGPDSAAYSQSDIDLFVHGIGDGTDADDVIRYVDKHLRSHAKRTVHSAVADHISRDPAGIVLAYLGQTSRPSKMAVSGVLVVRTSTAVTFALDYPNRHVQVVLRLYKSPAEVVHGFDVDSCAAVYDGSRVLVAPRALRALNRGYNLVDMSRRSYTYEKRLYKYSHRGFAVAVPDFERERVPAAVVEQQFGPARGLARLLVLEHREKQKRAADADADADAAHAGSDNGSSCNKPACNAEGRPLNLVVTPERAGEQVCEIYGEDEEIDSRRRYRGRRVRGFRHRSQLRLAGRNFFASTWDAMEEAATAMAQAGDKPVPHEPPLPPTQAEVLSAEYSSVSLPWGPRICSVGLHDILSVRYFAQQPGGPFSTAVRVCSCFYYFDVELIFRDRFHNDARKQHRDRYERMRRDDNLVQGALRWLRVDPGRQCRIGSFYPTFSGDWYSHAYESPAAAEGRDGTAAAGGAAAKPNRRTATAGRDGSESDRWACSACDLFAPTDVCVFCNATNEGEHMGLLLSRPVAAAAAAAAGAASESEVEAKVDEEEDDSADEHEPFSGTICDPPSDDDLTTSEEELEDMGFFYRQRYRY